MPTLKGAKASLPYVQCFLYLVSFNECLYFHISWLVTFWRDLVFNIFINVFDLLVLKQSQLIFLGMSSGISPRKKL